MIRQLKRALFIAGLLLLFVAAQATACPPFHSFAYNSGGEDHGADGKHLAIPATGEVFTEATVDLDRFDLDPGNRFEEAVVCFTRTTKDRGWHWIEASVYVKGNLSVHSDRRADAIANVSVVLWKNGERVDEKVVKSISAHNSDDSASVDQVVFLRTKVFLPKNVPITYCGGIKSWASVDGGGGFARSHFHSSTQYGLVSRLVMKPVQ